MQRLRRDLGQPSVRWTGPCLTAALQLAVKVRSWPAAAARQALLLVAADTRTRSPMRLAEAGPWWDHAEKQVLSRTPQEQAELDGLERLLADCDDRALLQAKPDGNSPTTANPSPACPSPAAPPDSSKPRPDASPPLRCPTGRTAQAGPG